MYLDHALRGGVIAALVLSLVTACPGGLIVDDDTDSTGDDDTTGLDDGWREEVLAQTSDGAVDVLFVVDNSCSMIEEQAALATHVETFIEALIDSAVDYHIGITVLDSWPGQPVVGELFGDPPYIDTTTQNPVTAFLANMTMGADGMGACEVGLEATYRCLTPPLVGGANDGFYREEAQLTVVVISDEVDASTTDECDPSLGWTEFVPWFTTLKGASGIERVHFGAIVGDRPDGCTSDWGDAWPGDGYLDVVDALGPDHSTFHSICDQDWSQVMTDLGTITLGLNTSFPLAELPIPGTLQVFLDPDGGGPEVEFQIYEDPTYSIDFAFVHDALANTLEFATHTAPPSGSTLRVTYQTAV
jgi:hypothetical protein